MTKKWKFPENSEINLHEIKQLQKKKKKQKTTQN